MKEFVGKTISLSGMLIQIISDDGETLQCNNLTTKQALTMQKAVVDKAIRLGKAEVITNN